MKKWLEYFKCFFLNTNIVRTPSLKAKFQYIARIIVSENKYLERNQDLTIAPRKMIGFRTLICRVRLRYLFNLLLSIKDVLCLIALIVYLSATGRKNKYTIIYTAPNFLTKKNGLYFDRVTKGLGIVNKIYINDSKQLLVKRVESYKVYNIGPIVNVVSRFICTKYRFFNYFLAYSIVNDFILFFLPTNTKVCIKWFYSMSGFSLVFSRFAHKIVLCEIQHGSIISYPPYSYSIPVQSIKVFYVRDVDTSNYLKNVFFKNVAPPVFVINSNKHLPKFLSPAKCISIFYASTPELNGFHPVFKKFITAVSVSNEFELDVVVRLHPRELNKKYVFESFMSAHRVIKWSIDNSIDWIEGVKYSNSIIISPWSSIVEEACNLGFRVVVIDSIGKKRYKHIVNQRNCFFSQDLYAWIKASGMCLLLIEQLIF